MPEALFTMSEVPSGRSVLPFPAEPRLEIYRHLVCKTYLALPTWCAGGKLAPPSAGLVILRVSEATSSEALKLLYEESIFLFRLSFQDGFRCEAPSQKAVALMNNVWFDISDEKIESRMDKLLRLNYQPPLEYTLEISRRNGMNEMIMAQFTGTASLRNTMRVRFLLDPGRDALFYVPRSFYRAMEYLGGFRKLVVEFERPCKPESDEPTYSRAISRLWCEKNKDKMLEHDFKPAYGPVVQGAVHSAHSYRCYLEFHPRQYLAENDGGQQDYQTSSEVAWGQTWDSLTTGHLWDAICFFVEALFPRD